MKKLVRKTLKIYFEEVLNYTGSRDLEKLISNFSSSLSMLHKNSREEKIQLTFLLFTVFA